MEVLMCHFESINWRIIMQIIRDNTLPVKDGKTEVILKFSNGSVDHLCISEDLVVEGWLYSL